MLIKSAGMALAVGGLLFGTAAAQADNAAATDRSAAGADARDNAVTKVADARDPNYRWHNNHWWYRTNNGWVFWHDNTWRPYNRSTYYSYYPRGWNRGYSTMGPYRSGYRWPGSAYGYNNARGYRYGYPDGWRGRGYYSRGYSNNRGWNDGLRFGGRGMRRW